MGLQRLCLVMLALQQELTPQVLLQCDVAPARRSAARRIPLLPVAA